MAAALSQSFSITRGSDVSLVLTGEQSTDPTGWALALYVALSPTNPPDTGSVALTVSSGFTIGGSGPYTITVPLTRAQTSALTSDLYHFSLWRTDSGSNVRLAFGTLTVNDDVRPPA